MSLYYFIFSKKQMIYGINTNKSADQIIKNINEGMTGFREIRILRIKEFFLQYLYKFSKQYAFNSNLSQIITQAPRFIIEFLLFFSLMSLTFLYVFIYEQTLELLSALAVIAVASVRLLPAFNSITNTILTLRYQLDTVNRLYDDIREFGKSQKSIESDKEKVNNFSKLKLEGVSFSYAGHDQEVLRNVSLEINRGEIIGIAGKSGSGKTTLVDIILGFLKPKAGKILLNNKKFDPEKCSFSVYIPQENFIIDATIKENIALASKNNEIDLKQLSESIKLVKLEDLLNSLPKGLETHIGQNGARLSGGQKQRIILARAIYSKRELLVLDEATSALDEETEEKVLKNLIEFNKQKTIIFISHRAHFLNIVIRFLKLKMVQFKNLVIK